MLDVTSDAIQDVIIESGEQIREVLGSVSLAAQVVTVWFVCSWIWNRLQRSRHGNTSVPRLITFDGSSSVWEIKGSKETHRVRVSGSGSGCACRMFLSTGQCGHLRVAQEAHKKLAGASPTGESSSSTTLAAIRGRAALGLESGERRISQKELGSPVSAWEGASRAL